MKKFFKRTGLLLAAAFIGAAAMQAQKSPQDMDRLYRCPDEANDRRGENKGQLNLPVTVKSLPGKPKAVT